MGSRRAPKTKVCATLVCASFLAKMRAQSSTSVFSSTLSSSAFLGALRWQLANHIDLFAKRQVGPVAIAGPVRTHVTGLQATLHVVAADLSDDAALHGLRQACSSVDGSRLSASCVLHANAINCSRVLRLIGGGRQSAMGRVCASTQTPRAIGVAYLSRSQVTPKPVKHTGFILCM